MQAITKSVLYVSLTREHPAEVLMRRTAGFVCVALIFAYIYFASASVFHAVMQRTAEGLIEGERTELAHLEKEYFSLSKRVDQRMAFDFGLTTAEEKHFVNRTAVVGVATAKNTRDF